MTVAPSHRARRCARLGPALAALALAGCDATTVTVVTVQARPAVRAPATLTVDLANANATITQVFDLRGIDLPADFTVTTPERQGTLQLTATATDVDMVPVATAQAEVEIEPGGRSETTLLLEPTDFVVNTIYAGSQRTAFEFGGGGRQIAATSDGTFTIGFSDDCGQISRCDVWGRRFGVDGTPLSTVIAAGTTQFNVNRTAIYGNDPSLALGPAGNLVAVWSTQTQIVCSALGPDGAATSPVEVALSDGTAPDHPAVAAVGSRFAVAWQEQAMGTGADVIRLRMVDAACQPVTAATTVSSVGTPDLAAAASSLDGTHAAIAWRSGTSIRGTFVDENGAAGAEQRFLDGGSDATVWGVQLAGIDGGFGLVYGLRSAAAQLPDGGFVLHRMSPTGTLLGVETTFARAAPDTLTSAAIARRADGRIGLAWQDCTAADGSGCAILGVTTRADGTLVDAPFVVDTSGAGDQEDPSIAALPDAFAVVWTDGSLAAPDKSETGIRARIVYPR